MLDWYRVKTQKLPFFQTLMVGDVTNLAILSPPFDITIDVGCFHCLNYIYDNIHF